MSRKEAMNALIESGMELRRDDIELGKKQERERIIKLLEDAREAQPCGCDDCGDHVWGKAIDLIKGEQK